MNKKTIAIILTLVILFNFISYTSVQAEPITLGVGYLVFAAILTSLGVTVATQTDMESLYNAYKEDIGTDFTMYLESAKLLLQGLFEQGSAFVPDWNETNMAKFYNWVRTKFNVGNNTISYIEKTYDYQDDFPNEDISTPNYIKVTQSFTVGVNNSAHLSVNGYYVNVRFTDVGNEQYKMTYDLNGMTGTSYVALNSSYFLAIQRYDSSSIKQIMVKVICNGRPYYEIFPYGTNNTYVPQTKDIPYTGSDVLTNPTWQPQQIPIPPPPVGFPGIQDTPDGRTYTGTPNQLVQDLDGNQSAVQEMVGQYINQNPYTVGGIGSIPTYNSGTGTISFPNTTVDNPAWEIPVESPWDIPLEIPADIPVPSDVPAGLGVIGYLLKYIAQGITGIYNILANMFSAPTKTITFEPFMNLNVKDRFPFCLPWDLYNTLQGISADPVIPTFEGYIKDVPLKIDFTVFEPLAVISRWAFTVIYTFTLIMISRRLIGGE